MLLLQQIRAALALFLHGGIFPALSSSMNYASPPHRMPDTKQIKWATSYPCSLSLFPTQQPNTKTQNQMARCIAETEPSALLCLITPPPPPRRSLSRCASNSLTECHSYHTSRASMMCKSISISEGRRAQKNLHFNFNKTLVLSS